MRSKAERERFRRRIHQYERTLQWKLRSARFRAKHGPLCDACRVRTGPGCPMHVHHRTYDRAFGGREPDRDLNGLCPGCHARVHHFARRGMSLDAATDYVIRESRRAGQPVWRKLLRLLTGL